MLFPTNTLKQTSKLTTSVAQRHWTLACRNLPGHHAGPMSWLVYLLCLLLLAAPGHTRELRSLPSKQPHPINTLQQLTTLLHSNDLVGYAKASATAKQYSQLETAWRQGRSVWPLSNWPLGNDIPGLIFALAKPQARQQYTKVFDTQFAGQGKSIRDAVQSLELFGVQYLQNRANYPSDQSDYYVKLTKVISHWASTAPFDDSKRAHRAIALLAQAAQQTGLTNSEEFHRLGMEESLNRLRPFITVVKHVLADYGLDLDIPLTQFQANIISQTTSDCQIHAYFPLAQDNVDTQMSMVYRENQWFLKHNQEAIDTILAKLTDPPRAYANPQRPPAEP